MTFRATNGLHVVGVRHHSPACARLVLHTLREVRPRHVLIEGPADMNARLAELLLPHALPVAIFTSHRDAERTHVSWTPFCDYSPEWVALREGHALGAQVRFIDLPAWSPSFQGVRNRYSDRKPKRRRGYIERLCEQLAIEGSDALWDHLFEQPLPPDALADRLRAYCEALRADEPESEDDAPRESFMQRHIEAALSDGGPVVVVCGGFHAPVLARATPAADGRFPEAPSHPGAKSFLVPYSFRRLDAFTGYESGMPSPAFYEAVWTQGVEKAPDAMLHAAVVGLRQRGQQVSAADLIAASTLAQGLARLRGHSALSRSDLLDGLASALVKDALEVALPWTERGVLSPRTAPMIAEILRAFSGEARGQLAPGTPRPPLLVEVGGVLADLELEPRRGKSVRVELTEPRGRERSRALHRLRVLKIPGFRKESGPAFPTDPILHEDWTLSPSEDFEAAVIEASGWGPSLEEAAAGRLEEALGATDLDLSQLALLLAETLFIGASRLTGRVLHAVEAQAGREPDLVRLGAALERLLAVWRHDVLLGAQGSTELGQILRAIVERGLWLLEHVDGPTQPAHAGQLQALVALRDALKHGAARLGLDPQACLEVFRRRMAAPTAPPAIRGGALGALWSLEQLADAEQIALRAMRAAALPATFGDFLAGLFALAREQVARTPGPTSLLNEVIAAMSDPEFLIAIPSLRLAFAFFPPGEKADIARSVLQLHGQDPLRARELLRLEVTPALVAAGARLDDEVERLLQRHGLAGKEEATDGA